jgi:hypothetical protein
MQGTVVAVREAHGFDPGNAGTPVNSIIHAAATRRAAWWAVGVGVFHAILAAGAFAVLASVFGFPEILREPAGVALARFAEDPTTIQTAYYAFTFSSFLYVPMAFLANAALGERARWLGPLAGGLAVGAAVTQVLGFARWTILVPFLAERWTAGQETAQVELLFEVFNRYAGMTVGEHLGWLFQAGWVAVLALAMTRGGGLVRGLGVAGLVVAAGILVGSYEPFGIAPAVTALAQAIFTTAFPFWFIAAAAALTRRAKSRS